MNTKKCLHCNEQLPLMARADAKFCPDKHGSKNFCKNAYHNKINLFNYRLVTQNNKVLLGNRRILKHLLGNVQSRYTTIEELDKYSFKMSTVSGVATTTTGQKVYHYLDISLIIFPDNKLFIQPL